MQSVTVTTTVGDHRSIGQSPPSLCASTRSVSAVSQSPREHALKTPDPGERLLIGWAQIDCPFSVHGSAPLNKQPSLRWRKTRCSMARSDYGESAARAPSLNIIIRMVLEPVRRFVLDHPSGQFQGTTCSSAFREQPNFAAIIHLV